MKTVLLTLYLLPLISFAQTKVMIALNTSLGNEPYIQECFIAGYESGGQMWEGEIIIRENIPTTRIVDSIMYECIAIGCNLVLRNTGSSVYYNNSALEFYELGIQIVTCGGSNSHVYTFPTVWQSHPVICGAGDTSNVTSYLIDFFSAHPYGFGWWYQSYGHAYVGGQLCAIKDKLNCSWWEARYRAMVTGSENGYDFYNGYGKINIKKAITYVGEIPKDPYL